MILHPFKFVIGDKVKCLRSNKRTDTGIVKTVGTKQILVRFGDARGQSYWVNKSNCEIVERVLNEGKK